jgi:hypothetical protein
MGIKACEEHAKWPERGMKMAWGLDPSRFVIRVALPPDENPPPDSHMHGSPEPDLVSFTETVIFSSV